METKSAIEDIRSPNTQGENSPFIDKKNQSNVSRGSNANQIIVVDDASTRTHDSEHSPAITPRNKRVALVSTRMESRAWRRRCCVTLISLAICTAVTVAAFLVSVLDHNSISTPEDDRYFQNQVLFLWRDAGEALALLPVFRSMRDNPLQVKGHDQLRSVTAVVTGYGSTPEWLRVEPGVTNLTSMGLDVGNLVSGDSNASLPYQAVKYILDRTQPAVLVTGMVSRVQMQVAEAAMEDRRHSLTKRDPKLYLNGAEDTNIHPDRRLMTELPVSAVVGYIDGFGTSWKSTLWGVKFARRNPSILDEIWTTADEITRTYRKHIEAEVATYGRHTLPQIKTMGSPTLSDWEQAVMASPNDVIRVRREVFNVADTTPVIHFFGGKARHTPEDPYIKALKVFASVVKRAQDKMDNGGLQFVATFSPHPGVNQTGEVERIVFYEAGANVTIVLGEESPILAKAANATLSFYSTCGIQSLILGVPHAYVAYKDAPSWENVASDIGFITTCRTADELDRELDRLHSTGFTFNTSRFESTGVPVKSSERRILDGIRILLDRL
mmetsp:Transcript_28159/g.68481  ORF Transcript_28159/g.68481 Transcript_28159/m.68481 type:complete len:553 (+) Transcript_28159:204-1862(+)